MSDEIYVSTVGDMINALSGLDADMPLEVSFKGGGKITVARRDLVDDDGNAKEVVAIYNSNGGRFGTNPLNESEYEKKSLRFIKNLSSRTRKFTKIHGDWRLYSDWGEQSTCYGEVFDPRIIHRMHKDGLIEISDTQYGYRTNVTVTKKGLEYLQSVTHPNASAMPPERATEQGE